MCMRSHGGPRSMVKVLFFVVVDDAFVLFFSVLR